MAIKIQFYNIIIPIENIERCSKVGGLKGIIEKQQEHFGRRVLCDEYLYRDGTMSLEEMAKIIQFWQEQGLVPYEFRKGKQYWKDFCVISQNDESIFPCVWLEYDSVSDWPNGIVSMKGKPKGHIVKPVLSS